MSALKGWESPKDPEMISRLDAFMAFQTHRITQIDTHTAKHIEAMERERERDLDACTATHDYRR